jgi:F-type H+-transporting ATPase subunit b
MDKTLQALGGILLNAVPTFLIVLFLHFYLKRMFFKPMHAVLERRYAATEGARQLAEESMQKAAARTAEYEAALRSARAEVYQAQEKQYHKLQEQMEGRLAEARQRSEMQLRQVRERIAADAAQARAALAGESETLAGQVADAILQRSVA